MQGEDQSMRSVCLCPTSCSFGGLVHWFNKTGPSRMPPSIHSMAAGRQAGWEAQAGEQKQSLKAASSSITVLNRRLGGDARTAATTQREDQDQQQMTLRQNPSNNQPPSATLNVTRMAPGAESSVCV